MLDDIAPGVAAELVAARVRLAFPLAVLLPRMAGAVVPVAVELDCEFLYRPPTVDEVAAGLAVDGWRRQVVFAQKLDERLFELAEDAVGVAPEDLAELRGVFRVASPLEDLLDLVWRRAVQDVRLMHSPSELLGGNNRG